MKQVHARKWRAKWIWEAGNHSAKKNVVHLFRKALTVPEQAGRIQLFITADTRYQFFIDGKKVGEGPPQSSGFHYYYDTYDVTDYLSQGRHCLAVIVQHQGISPANRGGLLAEICDANGRTLAGTDDTWLTAHGRAWQSDTFRVRMSYYVAFQERYDARKEPEGWQQIGYDDSHWQQAVTIEGRHSDRPPAVVPWTVLQPRDIPFMRETARYATSITHVEESLDVLNRTRPDDLSITLSVSGQPVQYTMVEGSQHLLQESGETVVQCSTGHLTGTIDGVYNPSIVLDFGHSINAYPLLELEGVDGGVIDIGYAERLLDGHFNNAIEGQFVDRYVMKDGKQTFRPLTWKSFRYLKLVFRQCSKPVRILNLKAIETAYPFESRGKFRSDDEVLNRVFAICRHTIQLCSHEGIMDTPWREQAQFPGDTAGVTAGGIYACFGDQALVGKFIRQSGSGQLATGFLPNVSTSQALETNADWQTVIPDYSLWWIHGLWQHYEFTGDIAWIHTYYPHVMKIIQAFAQYIGEDGLLEDVPYHVLIDWADLERAGISAALNAMFYGISGEVLAMAKLKQDDYTYQWLHGLREGIKASFDHVLYDAKQKHYRDAAIDGVKSSKVSEHSNMAAVHWGLTSRERAHEVIEQWLQNQQQYTESQPFFSAITLKALLAYGYSDEALAFIRERWGKRMVDRGATATYEEWQVNGTWRRGTTFTPLMRSQTHAWSAYPAEFLIRELAGFSIIEPGGQKVKLQPVALSFNAEVCIPLVSGEVVVRWLDRQVHVEASDGIEVMMQ